jgi:ABC-2 type transport system ATP-binding protein
MEITIENLTKVYGTQKAVDNISFNLKSGEVLGFLGPNGAGKSTTMKIISCFMAPTSGNVKVEGKSVFENPEDFKLKIGYLPESNPLYSDMYIRDYLRFAGLLQKVPKSKIEGRINEIIDYTGLGKEKHKRIGELSKGYRQRVGLAQALIHDPEILILDEPTTGLDPNQIVEIRELITNLGKEKTILLSTHILQEVEAVCDRIIIINNGKLAADASPENLRGQITGQDIVTVQIESGKQAEEVTQALGHIKEVEAVKVLDSKKHIFSLMSSNSYQVKKAVFDLCVQNKWYLLQMRETETKLEDIFRKLTSNN